MLDDDTAGLVLDPTELLDISESGGTTTVMVNLSAQPTLAVTVTVSSSDRGELTVPSAPLVFMAANWNVQQPVTLSGVADSLVDGPQEVEVTYTVSSTDSDYSVVPPRIQTQVVTDVDSGSLVSNPLTSLATALEESGGSATVTLQLSASAGSPVTLAVWSSDTSVATLSQATVRLELTNASEEAVVMVGAVDNVVSRLQPFVLMVSVTGGPGDYDEQTLSVTGMVTDNDVPDFGLLPSSSTLPDLAEGSETLVMVTLATQPLANVNVAVSSSDTDELTVPPTPLVFSTDNWNIPQAVALAGVLDRVVDGSKPVTVTYDISSTVDPFYNVLASKTQSLNVTDSDVPGFVLTPDPLPNINESGDGDAVTVTVGLATLPSAGVTLVFTSPNPAATLSALSITAMLTTLADNATVTLMAVNDFVISGDRPYALKLSVSAGPAGYAGLELTVSAIVEDDDIPSLVLDQPALADLPEGNVSFFNVRLSSVPTAMVTVTISSSDGTEVRVFPTRLEFTPTNWNVFQFVELTGESDDQVDGTQQVMMIFDFSSTGDSNYNDAPDVNQPLNVTDSDRDSAGLASSLTTLPNIRESDGTATVIVRLLAAAEPGVALSFTSQFTSVATLSSTPLLATLTTTMDRATITLGAVNDAAASGNRDYALLVSVVSGPPGYAGLTLYLAGTVQDDEEPNLLLDPPDPPDVTEGSETLVTVRLGTQPASNVDVVVESNISAELTVSPEELRFTSSNWDTNQIVTLSGVTDDVVDGLKQVTVTYDLSSGDPGYATVSDVTQEIGVIDSDVAGFMGIPDTLPNLNENGGTATGTATLTVGLQSAADPGVTVVFTNPTPAVATLSSTSLRVMLTTTADRATVTLSAIDDTSSGDRVYSLKVSVEAGPGGYSGLERTVTGTVLDDDIPRLVLDPPALPDLQEGSTSQLMVNLSIQPTSDVTVAVSSSDRDELTVPPTQLVFTSATWSTAQPVMLTGVEDDLVDGHETSDGDPCH